MRSILNMFLNLKENSCQNKSSKEKKYIMDRGYLKEEYNRGILGDQEYSCYLKVNEAFSSYCSRLKLANGIEDYTAIFDRYQKNEVTLEELANYDVIPNGYGYLACQSGIADSPEEEEVRRLEGSISYRENLVEAIQTLKDFQKQGPESNKDKKPRM